MKNPFHIVSTEPDTIYTWHLPFFFVVIESPYPDIKLAKPNPSPLNTNEYPFLVVLDENQQLNKKRKRKHIHTCCNTDINIIKVRVKQNQPFPSKHIKQVINVFTVTVLTCKSHSTI